MRGKTVGPENHISPRAFMRLGFAHAIFDMLSGSINSIWKETVEACLLPEVVRNGSVG
jgi:hypothetical protein